jgi:indole-3-glycerol phosphate synthase
VSLPILRKDFTVSEYQIYEAKAIGASAVLLICSILTDTQLASYITLANSLGLSVLVEAHDEEEVTRAVNSGARIIGVNNRDLHTFDVDTNNSLRLRKSIPENVLFVSESGISGQDDIRALSSVRPDAVLIGEAMMRSDDKTLFLGELRAAYEQD